MSEHERGRVEADAEKMMRQIVKEVKRTLAKRAGLGVLAKRAIAGSPPLIRPRERSFAPVDKMHRRSLDSASHQHLIDIGKSFTGSESLGAGSWGASKESAGQSMTMPVTEVIILDKAASKGDSLQASKLANTQQ